MQRCGCCGCLCVVAWRKKRLTSRSVRSGPGWRFRPSDWVPAPVWSLKVWLPPASCRPPNEPGGPGLVAPPAGPLRYYSHRSTVALPPQRSAPWRPLCSHGHERWKCQEPVAVASPPHSVDSGHVTTFLLLSQTHTHKTRWLCQYTQTHSLDFTYFT